MNIRLLRNFRDTWRTITAVQWFALGLCAGMALTTGLFVTGYILLGP